MTKLKIDLQNGIIDVEGEEAFVLQIYHDFKEKISEKHESNPTENETTSRSAQPKGDKPLKPKAGSAKKTARLESFSTTSDITATELKKFFTEKSPKTKYENNAVFVYYLQKKQNISKISLNHIYTCYKLVDIKVPKALKQSLIDTAFHKQYFITKDLNDIKLTIVGENFIEHDLPTTKTE